MLRFPIDRAAISGSDARPYIVFKCDRSSLIALPMPASMQFADGTTYNNAELGMLGGAINSAKNVDISSINAFGTTAAAEIKELGAGSITEMIAGALQASGVGGETVQSAISIGTGTTLNKNITTEFTSVNTRTFSFAFQLVSNSSRETDMIAAIVMEFRHGLYPEKINEFQLRFPPKWTISYLPDNKYLPKIGELYLTGATTAYNSTANMWRRDGSPLETTLTLEFTETKAYDFNTLPKYGSDAVGGFEGDINSNGNNGNIA